MRCTSKTILPYYNFEVYSVHSSFISKIGLTVGRAHFLHNLCSQKYQQFKGVYLPCHTGLKLTALPKYWLFGAKSNSLMKKLGKCNGTKRNLLDGQNVLVALLIKLHTNAQWCCQKKWQIKEFLSNSEWKEHKKWPFNCSDRISVRNTAKRPILSAER